MGAFRSETPDGASVLSSLSKSLEAGDVVIHPLGLARAPLGAYESRFDSVTLPGPPSKSPYCNIIVESPSSGSTGHCGATTHW